MNVVFETMIWIKPARSARRPRPRAFYTKNDEFCTENDVFCTENDVFCTENDEFCTENDVFCTKNDHEQHNAPAPSTPPGPPIVVPAGIYKNKIVIISSEFLLNNHDFLINNDDDDDDDAVGPAVYIGVSVVVKNDFPIKDDNCMLTKMMIL